MHIKHSDVTRHVPPTQSSLTVCVHALATLHHAKEGCQPQSVKSCGPRALRFTKAHRLAVPDVSLAPVSHKVGCESVYWQELRHKVSE